jgi:hypothetical protein
MKRATVWILVAGAIVIGGVVLTLQAKEQGKTPAQPPAPAPSGAAATQTGAPAEGETIAFTFTDDAQMQQFARLWQMRQGTIARMAVLQAYWGQEQGNLKGVNEQLLSQYNLDVSKNYTLDTNRKALVERPAPAEPPPAQLGDAPAQPPQ